MSMQTRPYDKYSFITQTRARLTHNKVYSYIAAKCFGHHLRHLQQNLIRTKI